DLDALRQNLWRPVRSETEQLARRWMHPGGDERAGEEASLAIRLAVVQPFDPRQAGGCQDRGKGAGGEVETTDRLAQPGDQCSGRAQDDTHLQVGRRYSYQCTQRLNL